MAATEAQKRASDKWLHEKIETITLRVPKGKRILIQKYAERRGESVNAMFNRLVDEAMERDNAASE